MKWISFNDDIPDTNEEVLVTYECGTIEIGIVEVFKGDVFVNDHCDKRAMATHWMPLPEPPKNGG